MRFSIIVAFVTALLGFAGVAAAQQAHPSKYAGQETRAIKSLSSEDIAELRRGGGWGMARAAELNGVPGPSSGIEERNTAFRKSDRRNRGDQKGNDAKGGSPGRKADRARSTA